MASEAFVTLATNDQYALGAMVWAASLRQVATQKQIVILITKGVSESIRNALSEFADLIQVVDVFESADTAILQLLKRPELSVTLTKIHCWNLTQFKKCVFMDADTLVVQNIDELFEREELSAVADIGWPDCFNSGVFVFVPSQDTFKKLVNHASVEGTFDGGDQGLLNSYFADWATKDINRHLSFIYNMTLVSTYTYEPAYLRYGSKVKVIHFLGTIKPWFYSFNASTGQLNTLTGSKHVTEFVTKWWATFSSLVHPKIESLNLVGSVSNMSIGSPSTETGAGDRFAAWGEGKIDYLGEDSFANIQKKLDESLKK